MSNEELFDKYLSNTLTAGEEQSFYDLLQKDEFGQQFVEYSLEVFCNTKTAADLLKGNTSKERKELIQKNKKPLPFVKYLTAAVSALAIVLISLWLAQPVPEVKTEVSRVGERANVIHGGTFQSGDTIKTDKPTHFEFMDGSGIKLDGEISVENEKTIFLKSGSISINAVPQGDHKLKILTENASVTVFDTSFTLHKKTSGVALEVSEGKVLFEHNGVRESILAGFGAITFKGKIISSAKGLRHVNFLLYKSILTSDSSLIMYTPMENTDPLKAFGFASASLVSGKFVKGRTPFIRALQDGILEIKGSENFNLKTPCTIGAWINISSFENYSPILTKGDNAWRLQMNINGKRVYFGFGDNDQFINSKKFNELNKWYFLTIVCTEENIKIYINAELENEKALNSYNFTNDSTIMIGGNKAVPDQKFTGKIGDVFILQRALSFKEVQSLYLWGK